MKSKLAKQYPEKMTDNCNSTPTSDNPIEDLRADIRILNEEIVTLKFELLDCYRRLDS